MTLDREILEYSVTVYGPTATVGLEDDWFLAHLLGNDVIDDEVTLSRQPYGVDVRLTDGSGTTIGPIHRVRDLNQLGMSASFTNTSTHKFVVHLRQPVKSIRSEIRAILARFESKYGMTSAEMQEKRRAKDPDIMRNPDSLRWSILYDHARRISLMD